MTEKTSKKIFLKLAVGLSAGLLLGAGFWTAWNRGLPLRLISHYSVPLLQEEVQMMNECAECHQAKDFHRCSTCHDDHGAVEFAELPFFGMITFTGDVPEPGVIEINQILPYRDQPHTHITLKNFLQEQGVSEFESVSLTSRDGGLITIQEENLTDQALLLPFSDGVRFAAEDLHVSTWLKGLTGITVVGNERPLMINGERTSIGRLLLGPIRLVTVEPARVMYISGQDGQVREAQTAFRVLGAALTDIFADQAFCRIRVVDDRGESQVFPAEEIKLAVLIPGSSGPTLVLPDRGRTSWIKNVVEITTE